MMKVKIKQEFHDIKDYSKIYHVDEVHEFHKDRALHLIDLGIVEKVDTEATTKRNKKENDNTRSTTKFSKLSAQQ